MAPIFAVDTLTIESVITLGSVIGAFLFAARGMVYLGDRLWKREEDSSGDFDMPKKSIPRYDSHHEDIRSIISIQLEQIKHSNEQLKEMVVSFRSLVEDSKLKHEIVVNYLRNAEKTNDEIKVKVDRLHDRLDLLKGSSGNYVQQRPN